MDIDDEISDEENIQQEENTGSSAHHTPKTAFRTRKYETPGGSLLCVPIVDSKLIPIVGKTYGTLEECEEMYKLYAYNSGFDIRKSTQKSTRSGVITKKYYLCNRAGVPRKMKVDTLEISEKPMRKSTLECSGCRAKVRFDLIDSLSGMYKLGDFEDQHNHDLLQEEYRHLTKHERKLKYAEQLFIYNASKANIGPTKAHQLYSNMKGSSENVNGTILDFRNFKRDLNVYINESDSQMLVNKMEERKKYIPGFSFEYKVEDSELHSIFWADEVAKINYEEFNDIMSFDATYRTNRYNLMFIPFTGIDNHRKCVTFAAGLIRDETAESYTWLLNCFMKAFNKEPIMVVTDQDKSMEKAIKNVFKTSKHRLCMWHITQKLPSKVRDAIPTIEDELERDFKNRFDSIVWNMHIEPDEFEDKWWKLMNDFSLKNDGWFKHMYEIRSTWIPAYFIETEMFGLMRTTSRSESENAFFAHFTKPTSNLITFMSGFESAMYKQRSTQEKLDAEDIKTTREFSTKLKIEKNASKVYTRTVFETIQKEIEASFYNCTLEKMNTDDQSETSVFIIKDTSHGLSKTIQYKVLYDRKDDGIVCTCRNFLRYGLLCRHCFWVLKNFGIDEIPKQYIKRRWTKGIIPPDLRSGRKRYGNTNNVVQKLVNEANRLIDDCLQHIGSNENKLGEFVEKIKALKKEVEADTLKEPSKKKDDVLGSMIGVSKPTTIQVQNPPVGTYKGCANDKRLMGGKEMGIKQSNKRKMNCSKCGGTNHNSRTCERQGKRLKEAGNENLHSQQ